jgi:hypothetical protein
MWWIMGLFCNKNKQPIRRLSLPLYIAGFLLGFLFNPEDEGDIFLQTTKHYNHEDLFIVTTVKTSNSTIQDE